MIKSILKNIATKERSSRSNDFIAYYNDYINTATVDVDGVKYKFKLTLTNSCNKSGFALFKPVDANSATFVRSADSKEKSNYLKSLQSTYAVLSHRVDEGWIACICDKNMNSCGYGLVFDVDPNSMFHIVEIRRCEDYFLYHRDTKYNTIASLDAKYIYYNNGDYMQLWNKISKLKYSISAQKIAVIWAIYAKIKADIVTILHKYNAKLINVSLFQGLLSLLDLSMDISKSLIITWSVGNRVFTTEVDTFTLLVKNSTSVNDNISGDSVTIGPNITFNMLVHQLSYYDGTKNSMRNIDFEGIGDI